MTDLLDPTLLLLGLVVATGAFVQSSIGFGTAVVAAPFVVVVRPDLMPASLLMCAFALPVLQLVAGPREVAWQPLGWALVARLVATPLGVLLVASTSADVIALAVGVLILVTVLAAVVAVDIRSSWRSATTAGAISGISGTAASIGGPFFALVLRHEPPSRVRATMAVFFLVGTTMGLVGLALAGELTGDQVRAGLLWFPFLILGHVVSGPIRARMRSETLRKAVLVFCVVASVSVILRTLI